MLEILSKIKPFWDEKKISYSLKSCTTTSSNNHHLLSFSLIYSHLLLYSNCCFHCCNTIAILDSLLAPKVVSSYLYWLRISLFLQMCVSLGGCFHKKTILGINCIWSHFFEQEKCFFKVSHLWYNFWCICVSYGGIKNE